MRVLAIGILALFCAACASGGGLGQPMASGTTVRMPIQEPAASPVWPFPQAPRGSAIPPPHVTAASQAAPPEGPGAGGLDFGHWRSAPAEQYATEFQSQIHQRFAGQNAQAIRADLEHNGFACDSDVSLQCSLEVMEHRCAYDWYVVVEAGHTEAVARYEHVCSSADASAQH